MIEQQTCVDSILKKHVLTSGQINKRSNEKTPIQNFVFLKTGTTQPIKIVQVFIVFVFF